MNYTEIKLHPIQKELIKKLSKDTALNFNKLIIDGLESEHMNYHLKNLIKLNFVQKHDSVYSLTEFGKDYSGLLDDNFDFIERQPKVSVVLHAIRKTTTVENLVNKRLIQPYLGKIGHLTGKVKFGESFLETAKRELYEEAGLVAKNFQIETIYRKMRFNKNKEFVQDNIFVIVHASNFSGNLIKRTPFQENFWINEQFLEKNRSKFFDDFVFKRNLKPKITPEIIESCKAVTGF